MLGAEAIKQLAKNLAVPQGFASKLLGHAIPTIIGRLTAEGAVSEAIPTFVRYFLICLARLGRCPPLVSMAGRKFPSAEWKMAETLQGFVW